MKLIATKSLKYGTRRLKAGDVFEPRGRDARVLVFAGVAAEAPAAPRQVVKPAPLHEPVMAADDEALPSLRSEYERVYGKRPFMGWAAGVLRSKIAEAGEG